MGKLRAKAEAEAATLEAHKRSREEQRRASRRASHEEAVEPAAEWLAKWSGEKVDSTMLDPIAVDGIGPVRWRIKLDGFDLILQVLGKPPEEIRYTLWQQFEDGHERLIEWPYELLEPHNPPLAVNL